MNIHNLILWATATLTALIAGLFYAWSCSVVPGIGRLSDTHYLTSFQMMNRAILNPVFFMSFMGTVILLPVCTYMQYSQPVSLRFWLLLTATILYVVGVFGVTMFGNVPLNNALDAFNIPAASPAELAAMRLRLEGPWNSLNTIRTLANILSLMLVIAACMIHAEKVS